MSESDKLRNELEMARIYIELYRDIADCFRQLCEQYREELLRVQADRNIYMGLYEDVTRSGHDCNNCGRAYCKYMPDPGQVMRFNCPLWQAKEGQKCDTN